MKLWIALSNDFSKRAETYGFINASAMCPPKTVEMQQDNCDWYEIDLLRRMTDLKTPVKR